MPMKWLPSSGWGILAGLNAFISLEHLLDYTSSKAAILQSELARAPELTEQVYQNAREAIDKAGQGNYLMGFSCAVMAGLCAANAVYHATRKEE